MEWGKMKWAQDDCCARLRGNNYTQDFGRETWREFATLKPRLEWEDNIKVEMKQIGREVFWTGSIWLRVEIIAMLLRALLGTCCFRKCGKILCFWESVYVSRKILLLWMSCLVRLIIKCYVLLFPLNVPKKSDILMLHCTVLDSFLRLRYYRGISV